MTPSINDPKGAAGALKAPMWLLPPAALEQTAWVAKFGADKYGPYNWRNTGVCATTYVSAIMRHLNAWRDGEDRDPESGFSHIAHIATSCNILMDALACGTLQDDRNKRPDCALPDTLSPVVGHESDRKFDYQPLGVDEDEDEEIALLYTQNPESGITIDGTYHPFPEVPDGYARWEYRGLGWFPGRRVKYAFWDRGGRGWVDQGVCYPLGWPDSHYLEAIPLFGNPGDRVMVEPLRGPVFVGTLENFVAVRGTLVYTFRTDDQQIVTLTDDQLMCCTVQHTNTQTP